MDFKYDYLRYNYRIHYIIWSIRTFYLVTITVSIFIIYIYLIIIDYHIEFIKLLFIHNYHDNYINLCITINSEYIRLFYILKKIFKKD